MKEVIYTINPDEYRRIADMVGPDLRAEEIRKIADRVEADGEYVVIRPAYRVTFRASGEGPKTP